MMIFIAKKLLLDREITSLDFNIFKDQSNTQIQNTAANLNLTTVVPNDEFFEPDDHALINRLVLPSNILD